MGGVGKASLEAMACGTPLIVTSPAGRDFIGDFLSDWVLCEPSLDAVARCMHRLLEADNETRESLAGRVWRWCGASTLSRSSWIWSSPPCGITKRPDGTRMRSLAETALDAHRLRRRNVGGAATAGRACRSRRYDTWPLSGSTAASWCVQTPLLITRRSWPFWCEGRAIAIRPRRRSRLPFPSPSRCPIRGGRRRWITIFASPRSLFPATSFASRTGFGARATAVFSWPAISFSGSLPTPADGRSLLPRMFSRGLPGLTLDAQAANVVPEVVDYVA